eukprot:328216-Chlamydomonas_euryale.AAC.2
MPPLVLRVCWSTLRGITGPARPALLWPQLRCGCKSGCQFQPQAERQAAVRIHASRESVGISSACCP